MRWHDVIWAISQAAAADSILRGIYADAIYANGARNWEIPSLEYDLITDSASELWEPCTVQWDQWCLSMEDLVVSEARLREMFDHAVPTTIQGVVMWAEFTDGASLTAPERSGFYGRAARFRFTPLRDALRRGRS